MNIGVRPQWLVHVALGICAIAWLNPVQAASYCVGLLHTQSGQGATPLPYTGTQLVSQYLDVLRKKINAQAQVVTNDTEANSTVALQRMQGLRANQRCLGVFAERSVLAVGNGSDFWHPFGTGNPFSNIPTVYKQFAVTDKNRIAWVGTGWIPQNYPGLKVRKESDTIVIAMEEGHRGWPDFGVGLFITARENQFPADQFMDWVASPEANRLMGEWFYVVPDNSSLQRRVRIDLVSREGDVIASTACTSSSCYPVMVRGEVQYKSTTGNRTYTVCGKTSACPQFMPRPQYQKVP